MALVVRVVCSACAAYPETNTFDHAGANGESLYSSSTVVQPPVSAGLPTPVRWAYMLQNDVAAQITGTQFNVVIMDYAKDGTDDPCSQYTAAAMRAIRGDEPTRTVLAYVSVGEAERYRGRIVLGRTAIFAFANTIAPLAATLLKTNTMNAGGGFLIQLGLTTLMSLGAMGLIRPPKEGVGDEATS